MDGKLTDALKPGTQRSSSRRAFQSGTHLDNGDQASNGITPFEQTRHLRNLLGVEAQLNNGSEEMQRLATEKVHGTEGFKKHRCGSGHLPLHYRIRYSFKQCQVLDGEVFGFDVR